MRLEGAEAIEYAERNNLPLSKYADPIEGDRNDMTPEEARKVAHEDPSLIYIETATRRRIVKPGGSVFVPKAGVRP